MIDPKLFRSLLGSSAENLSDAEVAKMLEWSQHFSDVAIEWWKREHPVPHDAVVDLGMDEMRLHDDSEPRVPDADGLDCDWSDIEGEKYEMYAGEQ